MSSEAWGTTRCPGRPTSCWSRAARSAARASRRPGMRSRRCVGDAIEEQREAGDLDERLAAAGIGPDHPSLYPGGRSSDRAAGPRLRGRGHGRGGVRLVPLRRVDAREHHPARRAGPAFQLVGDGDRVPGRRDRGGGRRRRGARGAGIGRAAGARARLAVLLAAIGVAIVLDGLPLAGSGAAPAGRRALARPVPRLGVRRRATERSSGSA